MSVSVSGTAELREDRERELTHAYLHTDVSSASLHTAGTYYTVRITTNYNRGITIRTLLADSRTDGHTVITNSRSEHSAVSTVEEVSGTYSTTGTVR